MPPSVGYTIADVSTLTAIGSSDRADGYARLLLDDGDGVENWVVFDSAATSGDYQPDDTPATGYWKIIGAKTLRSNVSYTASNEAELQAFFDSISTLHIGSNNVTCQLTGNITLTGSIDCFSPASGSGQVIILGDTSTPSNRIISTSNLGGARPLLNFAYGFGGSFWVKGVEFNASAGGTDYAQLSNFTSVYFEDCDFGAATGGSITRFVVANANCNVYVQSNVQSNCLVSGGCDQGFVVFNAFMDFASGIAFSNSPSFTYLFRGAYSHQINANSLSVSGSATGIAFRSERLGVINAGSTAGFTTAGMTAKSEADGGLVTN